MMKRIVVRAVTRVAVPLHLDVSQIAPAGAAALMIVASMAS
jgi:hypothetical protein